MKYFILFIFIFLSPIIGAQEYLIYPDAPITDHSDTIFGKVLEDPYRLFEQQDERSDSWVSAQDKLLRKFRKKELKNFKTVYNYLYSYNYTNYKPLIKKGKNYYFFKYKDFYSSPSLYRQASYFGNPSLIINPQNFSTTGEILSITNFEVSSDENHIAFALSESGKDWRTIRIRDNMRAKFLDDEIKWVKYSNIRWKGEGFFYWKYDEPEPGKELLERVKNQKLYYHKLNTPQEEDSCVYQIPEKELARSSFEVTSDEQFLILYTFKKVGYRWVKTIIYKDLDSQEDFKVLLEYPKNLSEYSIIDNIGHKFYILTNFNANNYKVICFNAETNKIEDIVKEDSYVLDHVNIIANRIICVYYKSGGFKLNIFNLNGEMQYTKHFKTGYQVSGFEGNNNDTETVFFVNSFYFPSVVYKLNVQNNSTEQLSDTKIAYDHEEYETRFFNYYSKDSTAVPMYLTYKKGIDLQSGKNPVLLYGYGGFGMSMNPHYDAGYVLFLNGGGILATPQIRGGGELGSNWHDKGRKMKKQNSFDDFIAAGEYLIKAGVTNPEKLVINGGSNGGLLVGASLTQRPDLFKAAVIEMGVLDMLRYEKYGIGYIHQEEYGSVSDSLQFLNLLSYSPYHALRKGKKYPATLVITAENDDRVPPFHSYKFVSKLQAYSSGETPFLLFVQKQSGHYGSSTIHGKLNMKAYKYSFLLNSLNMDVEK